MNPSNSNKRKIGDKLEDRVLKALGSAFTKTGNSGATYKDGDIRHRKLVVECKVKSATKGFSAPASQLKKLQKTAELQGKDWLYIAENGEGKIMVLCDLNTFIEVADAYLNKREQAIPERDWFDSTKEQFELTCVQCHCKFKDTDKTVLTCLSCSVIDS